MEKKLFITTLLVLACLWGCAQTEQRIPIANITPALNTGMDYSSWLNDDLNNLVPNCWASANNVYTDVTLQLAQPATISRLSLYDWQGVFTQFPDSFFAVNGAQKTYIGRFTGEQYMAWVEVTAATPVPATAVVVRKYGNCIPQKIKIFGYLQSAAPAPSSAPPPIAGSNGPLTVGKIPIDGSRWYQLNSNSDGIAALFDGNLQSNISITWGKILSNYDAYYPLLPGEVVNIDSLRMFDYQGSNEWAPFTLYAIDSQWRRTLIATFTGSKYNEWVGPVPNAAGSNRFRLSTPASGVRYLVINTSGAYPTELELYGTYRAPQPLAPATVQRFPLRQEFGVNAFEWDFENPGNPLVIDESRLAAMKSFTAIRHYMDWEKLEQTEGSFTYNPTRSGSWNYDAMYERCKAEGIEVLACLKTIPDWMQQSYPWAQRNNENVPVRYGRDFADPKSYVEQARVAFQYAARYGSNSNVTNTLLSVNGAARWNNDPVNTVKKGMNLIHYLECDNERDKWWKERKAYQTGREYAANLSAFYDGHKNTMGAGVGVKNADPNMQVVMGGLANPSVDYLKGMIDWCKEFRGYKPDGSVNLCWDVINYHFYPNDAHTSQGDGATRGAAPEVAGADAIAAAFISTAHQYAADMPVWITETGYDINQGSPLKAIPIGNKTALQTQADWILRTALLYARSGVARCFFYQTYDENIWNPGKFASSGLLNSDRTRKPAADYLYQANKLMGSYSYVSTLSTSPLVDRYELDGLPAFALVKPSENGSSVGYTLNVGNANTARIYRPVAGQDSMSVQIVNVRNGQLPLTVTETPMFVIPDRNTTGMRSVNDPEKIAAVPDWAQQVMLYPNPAGSFVNLLMKEAGTHEVSVRILNAAGQLMRTMTFTKAAGTFNQMIDLSSLQYGLYLVEIIQGREMVTKKIIKSN